MGRLGYVLRQIRVDWPVTGLLAVIVAIGAAAAAAAQPWTTSTLDSALSTTISESGTELSRRVWEAPTTDDMESVLDHVVESEPVLDQAFGSGTWTISTGEGAVDGKRGTLIEVRGPRSLQDQVRIIGGWMPSTDVGSELVPQPDRVEEETEDGSSEPPPARPVVDVIVAESVAEVFGLAVGDEVRFTRSVAPSLSGGTPAAGNILPGEPSISLRVTGTFEPIDDDWAGWTDSHAAIQPFTTVDSTGNEITHGALLADPGVMAEIAEISKTRVFAEWTIPTAPEAVVTATAEDLIEATRRIEGNSSGWSTMLDEQLETYHDQLSGAQRVSALGATSIAALLVILVLLAMRLLIGRRSDALLLARTRGGQSTMLGRLLFLEALFIAMPAGAIGGAVGLWLIGDTSQPASYTAVGGLVLVVVAVLPVMGVLLARRRVTDRPEDAALRPSARRLVAEAGVVVIAGVVLWLLSGRGAGGEGIDPLVSLAPVVVATAAGLVTFRVLPYIIAAISGWTRTARGAAPFLSSARASRTSNAATLPVIAMLIAIGLAAIGAAIDTTAERGRQAAAWSEVPADLVLTNGTLPESADDVIEQVPGATAAALGYTPPADLASGPDGTALHAALMAVDVEGWRTVTSEAPDPLPQIEALSSDDSDAIPALVAGSGTDLHINDVISIGDVSVTVVGETSVFPGVPQSPALVVPADAINNALAGLSPSVAYLAGDVDVAAAAETFDATPFSRAAVLSEIDAAPLLGATREMYQMALYGAAALAGAAAVLSLLIASRSRASSLSILQTLGLTSRQVTGMVMAEVLPPAVIAAAVGVGVGSGITVLASDALDLSVLTTTLGSGGGIVLNVTGTALTAAGVLTVVLAAVALTVIATRRRNLGSTLRAGD